MPSEIIYINQESEIPLFGIDFLGIIDRGTNIIEVKPLTLCNLKCKYCFVNAGNYDSNFIVAPNYLIDKIRSVIEVKGKYNIEIHLAPYGEILLYPELIKFIRDLWNLDGIETISMQSNGLLITKEIIKSLEQVKLTRINISLNTLRQELAEYLCDCNNYNMLDLLKKVELVIESKIDILIAPVWFPGLNNGDIEDIIKYIINLRKKGYLDKKIQIGIQKYLVYKTGRKLKRIRPRSWGYFYKQLTQLEKKYHIKLKLGPKDFGIHKRNLVHTKFFKINDLIRLKIVSKGRWRNECIGQINKNHGIKVILKKPLIFSHNLIGKKIIARIIKANSRDNIFTAIFPIK